MNQGTQKSIILKNILKVIICYFLVLFPAKGTLKGYIGLTNKNDKEMKPGEPIHGVIRLWNYETWMERIPETLKEEFFLDFFYIQNVQEVKRSKNNSEVFEIYFLGVFYKNFPFNTTFIYAFENNLIPFEVRGINQGKIAEKPGDFKVFGNELELKKEEFPLKEVLILVGLIILSSGLIITFRILKIKKEKREKVKKLEEWESLFANALERVDFEEVYKQRKNWIPYLNFEENKINEFFKVINKHQYKKEWTDEETEEVKQNLIPLVDCWSKVKDGIH